MNRPTGRGSASAATTRRCSPRPSLARRRAGRRGFGGWIDQVNAGELRGAELDIAQYLKNGLGHRGRERHGERRPVAEDVRPQHESRTASMGSPRSNRGGSARRPTSPCRHRSTATTTRTPRPTDCAVGSDLPRGERRQLEELRAALRPVIDRIAADPRADRCSRRSRRSPPPMPRSTSPTPAMAARRRRGPRSDPGHHRRIARRRLPGGGRRPRIWSSAGITTRGWSRHLDARVPTTFELSCRPLDAPGRDCGTRSRTLRSRPAICAAPVRRSTSWTTPSCCPG